MQPTRILPDLQCSLPCEDVRQEANGNFILVGVIGMIRLTRLPVTAHKICIFDRWTAGMGNFVETVRFLSPDETSVIRKSQVKFTLKNTTQHTTNVSIFGQLTLRESGVHYIEVLIDDVLKMRYPMMVQVVKPPPGTRIPGPDTRTE